MVDDLEQQNTTVEPIEPVEPVATPAAAEPVEPKAEEKPLSLRDEINKVNTEIKARPRDENGKFIKDGKKVETKPATTTTEPAPKADETRFTKTPTASLEVAPRAYNNAVKAKWAEIPEDVRSEILRREEAVEKGFTKLDDERNFGKHLKEVINPYMPMIESEGSNPVQAVKSLLNTAYMLRAPNISPQQKGKLLREIAGQFGADLTIPQSSTGTPLPEVVALQQQVSTLTSKLTQQETMKEQQENATLNSAIDTFAADAKNVHYEAVKPRMAALLTGGQINSDGKAYSQILQEAYEMAIWADPQIRSKLVEQQKTDLEAKRLAETKNKADAAKKAGASINGGGPGAAVPKIAPTDRSLRDELKANLREASATIN